PELLTGWSSTTTFEGVRHDMSTDSDQDDSARRQRQAEHDANSRMRGAQLYGMLPDLEPVMSCDRDFDRRVTPEEFGACARERLAQIDTNHDGFFDISEAPSRLRHH